MHSDPPTPAPVPMDPAGFLAGGGEMGARVRAFDWASTPLGPVEGWPQALRTAVNIVLGSRYPMFLWWGPERVNLYNDAYAPILGPRHPAALGRPARAVWSEIWEVVGPQAEAVFARGEATWNRDVFLLMERRGFPEETYFTWSYSPVREDDGTVAGMFCACSEETARVLSQRRLETLRVLVTACAGAESVGEACVLAARALTAGGGAADVPFAGFYLLDHGRPVARLAAASGWAEAPEEIAWTGETAGPWTLAPALAKPRGVLVNDLAAAGIPATGGSARPALILPLAGGEPSAPAGFLVAGLSPRLVPDEDYRNFLGLVAGTVSATLERARARRENEARHALFARLFEAIRPLRDPEEIVRAVTRTAGEHLGADRCSYSEVNGAGTHATVLPGWTRDAGMSAIAGVHHLDSYGATLISAMRAGRVIVVADVETDPRTATPDAWAAWRAVQTRGVLLVPLVREGRLVANFFLNTRAPRAWTPAEVALAEQVAEQTWSALAAARAEGALRATGDRSRRRAAEQQAIYETALSTTPDLTYLFDLAGRFTYANRALLGLFGLPADAVIGKTFHELPYDPELAAKLARQVRQVIATREPLRDETAYPDPAGRDWLFEYIFTPAFNAAGEVTAVVGTTRDLTARMAAEQRVRASRDQFQQIADTAPAMLWITEPDGACTFLSRSWYEFTGQSGAEGEGLNWTNAIHPDERETARGAFLAASAARAPYQVDFRLRRADGEYRWVVDAGRPRFGSEGEFHGFIGSVIDIHERKAAEAALAERAAALRDADLRKDEFLAMLAHELRNPLASVLNAATLLGEGTDDVEERAWATEVIARQSNQLARLVDDLLDVSRITRGIVELRRVRLDAARALDAARETVAPQVAARGHTLFTEFPHGELWVEADPTRLEQIVVNLLVNAVRYTEPPGRLWLEARRDGAEVVITVRDNGIGIPPERIPAMFELFTQGERTAARSEGGLGIGLTVVRGLCELHGGSVAARSEGTGTGSTFTVRLPFAGAPAPAVVVNGPASEPEPGAGARILVVDDNVDTAAAMARLFTRRGYVVEQAHDGPAALERAREFSPAAVLLDIGLPGLDGYEVARRLRAMPGGVGTLIIALSGYGQEEDRARSREAGFDHHLVKPVNFEELRALLARGLAAR